MAEDNTGLTTGLTYECGSIKIANNFDVSVTRPLDIRLVVKNVESLYDTSVMKSPYKGMLVNIEGTSDVYVYTGTYKDENGIIHDGVNGVKHPQNWSKISTVEQFDDNIFKEEEYTAFDLENFRNVMEKQLHNPSIGLLGHVRDTSKIYVLVNKDYTSPGSWKRVGGVMEEFSVPVLIDNNNDNNGTDRKNANNSPHNTFSNNDSNPTTWVKINTSKSPESISTFGGVEMVTTEMLNNVTDEIYEKIEDVEDNLNIKIENNDIKINDRINDVIDIHNEDVKDINDYVEHEIDRVDKTISDNDKNINDKLNSTENEIYRHVNDVVENINKSIENVDEYHTLENERLEDKVDEVQDKLDMSIDDINQKIGELLKKHDDDIEKTVDELTTYINRLKNLILHGTIEDSDGMIHPSDEEKIDIEGTLKSIHYISDWLKVHKGEYDNLVATCEGHYNELNELIDKLKIDTEKDIKNALYYDITTIGIGTDENGNRIPDDNWKTENIGGIPGQQGWQYFGYMDSEGKYVSNKTLSEMMTDILFPTYQPVPEPNKPSMSISTSSETLFVGTPVLSIDTYKERINNNKNTNYRGNILYNNVKQNNIYYAGEEDVDKREVKIKNSKGEDFTDSYFVEDTYNITYKSTFKDGELLKTNKGVQTSIQYKSSILNKNGKINVVYPIFITGCLTSDKSKSEYINQTIDDVNQLPVINYFEQQNIEVTVPPETPDGKFKLYLPQGFIYDDKHVEINLYNPTKGVYDIKMSPFIKIGEEIKYEYTSSDGTLIRKNYDVYVRTEDRTDQKVSNSKYKITIVK